MRILFVTSRIPQRDRKGDQLRAFEQIRRLGLRHEVDLVCGAETPPDADTLAEVRAACRSVVLAPVSRPAALARVVRRALVSALPLQVLYFDAPPLRRAVDAALDARTYDVVHAQLLRVLPHLWQRLKPPVLVDLMDAFAEGVAERRDLAAPLIRPLYAEEHRRLRAYERAAVARFAELVVISESDRLAVRGGPRVASIGHGVDFERFPFGAHAGRDAETAILTGNFDYGPNADAARWLLRRVWPHIRERRPSSRLRFVGANPPRWLRAHAGPGIEVSGTVPDIGAELRRATVALCPVLSGTGIQTKVLEALASGTPLVTTPLGNRGVGAFPDRDLLVAGDAAAMAAAVDGLFADPERRARLGHSGRTFVETHHAWDAHVGALEAAYERAIRR